MLESSIGDINALRARCAIARAHFPTACPSPPDVICTTRTLDAPEADATVNVDQNRSGSVCSSDTPSTSTDPSPQVDFTVSPAARRPTFDTHTTDLKLPRDAVHRAETSPPHRVTLKALLVAMRV